MFKIRWFFHDYIYITKKEETLNQNNDGGDVDETVDEETQYNQKGMYYKSSMQNLIPKHGLKYVVNR